MATKAQLKAIMLAAGRDPYFKAGLDAALHTATANEGVVLTPSERKRFKLSVFTVDIDEQGGVYQFHHICASKGCTTVKGPKKAKKQLDI